MKNANFNSPEGSSAISNSSQLYSQFQEKILNKQRKLELLKEEKEKALCTIICESKKNEFQIEKLQDAVNLNKNQLRNSKLAEYETRILNSIQKQFENFIDSRKNKLRELIIKEQNELKVYREKKVKEKLELRRLTTAHEKLKKGTNDLHEWIPHSLFVDRADEFSSMTPPFFNFSNESYQVDRGEQDKEIVENAAIQNSKRKRTTSKIVEQQNSINNYCIDDLPTELSIKHTPKGGLHHFLLDFEQKNQASSNINEANDLKQFNERLKKSELSALNLSIQGWTPLLLAAKNCKYEFLKVILSYHPNLRVTTKEGWNALHLVCSKWNVMPEFSEKCVVLLLEKGMDANVSTTRENFFPIHLAAYYNSGAVKALLKKKININCLDKQGYSALHYAALNIQNSEALKMLCAQPDVDYNIQSLDGKLTPLMYAAHLAEPAMVKTLIHQSNVNLVDSNRFTAYDFATKPYMDGVPSLRSKKRNKIIQIFKKAKADKAEVVP